MRTISVGFSRPNGGFQPFSWLIKWFESTPYSHVFIQFHSNSFDRDLIYQASGLKVNCIGTARFQQIEIITDIFTLEVDDQLIEKMVQYCIDALGAPYDVGGAIGAGLARILKHFGKNWTNTWAKNDQYFCSELIIMLLFMVGDGTVDNPDTVLPQDVYSQLVKLNIQHWKNPQVYGP